MADVERRAEAEAEAKGLTGQARKSYIGGVFNKIRQAHARVVKPGKGKTFFANLNRRNRQLARARYQEALRPHEEAVAALKQQRKHELAQLSPEKRGVSNRELTQRILQSDLKPIRHVESVDIDLSRPVDPAFLREVYGQAQLTKALELYPTERLREGARYHGVSASGSREALIARLAQLSPEKRDFASAVKRAVAKRENGSGFATIQEVREELRRDTGLSDAAIDERLRKLRDEGDAGRAPLTLHFEPNEDIAHIEERGQLKYRGHDFDQISVLPSVQEQKRQDAADMERIRREEQEIFAAHGMEPPVRDPKTGKLLRPARPIKPPKPPKREPAERQRQHAIADAIKHGAPDFPPGTLAAAEGKPAAKPRAKYTPPRQDSWLRRQADPTDPREALSRAGSHEALYEHLKDEPMGVLENMADRVRKHGRKPGRNDRAGWARYIVEGMKQPPAPPAAEGKPAAKPAPSVLSVQQAADIPLTPRPEATGSRVRDPASPVDPYYLQHLYGDAQLHVALSRYTAPRLMEAVKAVQARHPGTKPAGGGRAELIAYIEQHVKGKPAPPPAAPAAMARPAEKVVKEQKPRNALQSYLAEPMTVGGVHMTRGEFIQQEQRKGTPQVLIDRYLQGYELGERIRARKAAESKKPTKREQLTRQIEATDRAIEQIEQEHRHAPYGGRNAGWDSSEAYKKHARLVNRVNELRVQRATER